MTAAATRIPQPGKNDTHEDIEAPKRPNVAGSTDLRGSYNSSDNSHMVSTELLLTGATLLTPQPNFTTRRSYTASATLSRSGVP
jgi:hypothetical protein